MGGNHHMLAEQIQLEFMRLQDDIALRLIQQTQGVEHSSREMHARKSALAALRRILKADPKGAR